MKNTDLLDPQLEIADGEESLGIFSIFTPLNMELDNST
jgi:hypothetical protein